MRARTRTRTTPQTLVVIVGSAGSLRPLRAIVRALHPDQDAAFVVLLHRSPDRHSYLTELLARNARVPVADATDGEALVAGHVYVAPQGEHEVAIEGNTIRLRPGLKVHSFQPSGDPLFVSAARSFGSRTIGVVLSGMGRNGEVGLAAIKRIGGKALVQHPADAEYPSIPLHALRAVHADLCATGEEIAGYLGRLGSVNEHELGPAEGS